MSTKKPQKNPVKKPAPDREARLKQALKDNMAKRKAQARSRGAGQEAAGSIEQKE